MEDQSHQPVSLSTRMGDCSAFMLIHGPSLVSVANDLLFQDIMEEIPLYGGRCIRREVAQELSRTWWKKIK